MRLLFDYDIEPAENVESLVEMAVEAALKFLSFSQDVEIGVLVTDDENIRSINNEFRSMDKSTDVLSFPLNSLEDIEKKNLETNPDTDDIMLGDMVFSIETCQRQGEEYGHGFKRELCYLTVHSVLHLLGYDHETDEDKAGMRDAEEKILATIGLER